MPTDITLHHQDCLAGMREMEDATIDLTVTSPPYNLGINYNNYDDTQDRDAYLLWCCDWAREVFRLLKDNGSFFLNVGASPSNPLFPHQILLALTTPGFFHLQNTFHWIKSITVDTTAGEQISVGHFKPINSPRYVNDCHEYVFHLTKTGNVPLDRRGAGVPYADKSNIGRWKHTEGHDQRCRGNTWFIPYKTITSRDADRPHPASFPPALVEQCLRLHGQGKNTVLLDPFLGIGSSALAARKQEIAQFTGFEIDAGYLSVAQERLNELETPDLFGV